MFLGLARCRVASEVLSKSANVSLLSRNCVATRGEVALVAADGAARVVGIFVSSEIFLYLFNCIFVFHLLFLHRSIGRKFKPRSIEKVPAEDGTIFIIF